MEVFNLKNNKVEFIELYPFKVEKEIQEIIEKNTDTFFRLEFVRSEFPIGEFRIDTLCFDKETSSFVLIEYKRGSSYSVIDQGYSYLSLMLNNKTEFIVEYNESLNRTLKRDDVDWTQSRIIFISQSFNAYQKNSINFKNMPFELWEIKRFYNETIILNKHISASKENINSISTITNSPIIQSVNKEVSQIDEDAHTSKTDKEIVNKWGELKSKIQELDNTELVSKRQYISLVYNTKILCYFNFRKNLILIEIIRGNINPDGTTSKNYFTINDPEKISSEGSWEWKSGVKGTSYKIKLTNTSDIDYIMFLITQKFKSVAGNRY
ncbi:hypothetical protein [Emticicia sp. TH156]|uniref:hypothetical protein n=1 Tax=Emticicia sp. TH156 TaxID=2067454 RepID=UPI000C767004|nr:hypothetical protein [Emticicia sp. TH156]PLK45378.1 hypothetical protein C0V77_04335 [Emticicia sp. TH156]